MEKQNYSILINAPKEKIWRVLWDDNTYRKWTNVFYEGSYAVSDWKEGSTALFLGPNKDGMYSIIDKCIENELMSIKHIGMVKNGIEMPPDEESKKWSGSEEIYKLAEKDGVTELNVDVDVDSEFAGFFDKTFPKALDKIKELSES
ncbi:MAG TPA: SRPBCC domain-containing protein [Ignavibacteria bacterium]|nr:SRPBCC domain-containing protein [Ignavibacteria bacterium]HMR39334.1 SRPBCC domain-containing protein [Ignavibacteria bacterium]